MITIIIEGKKSFRFYNVVLEREEFWASPWLVSHAENVVRGAYDDCGHFKDCSMPSSLHMSKNDSVKCQKMSQK